MKKNKLMIFVFSLFITALAVSLIMPVCAAEKPIVLTLAEYKTPSDLTGKGALILQEEIADKTNGKVNLKIYWAGSLIKGKEILRGVEDGVADMGNVNPNYYPNQLPIGGVYNIIPRGPAEYESQMEIYETVMEEIPEWKEEFLAHNQLPIYPYAMSAKAICSTKPLASLDDFENQKMRSAARWLLDMMEAAGGTPVSVPWGDCYMALQTGTIDAVLTNLGSLHHAKLDEVASNILLIDRLWAKPAVFYTINLDSWNKLSEEIQGQIMEAMETTAVRYKELYDADWDECIKEVEEMGCVVNTMSTEDMEKWVNLPIVGEIQAQWVKEMEKQGMENASEILEKIKSIVTEVVKKEEMNK